MRKRESRRFYLKILILKELILFVSEKLESELENRLANIINQTCPQLKILKVNGKEIA